MSKINVQSVKPFIGAASTDITWQKIGFCTLFFVGDGKCFGFISKNHNNKLKVS